MKQVWEGTIENLVGVLQTLKEYLLDHEGDIAGRINDFGDLRSVFIAMFGREPEL